MLWPPSEWFLFSSPAGSSRGFFSDICCGSLVELQEVTIWRRSPYHPVSLEILTLRPGSPEPPAICQSYFRVPIQPWFLLWFPLRSLCSVSHNSLYMPFVSLVPRESILLCVSSSLWIHKGLLIFQSVQFLLVIGRVAASLLLTNGTRIRWSVQRNKKNVSSSSLMELIP